MTVDLLHGSALDVLQTLPDESVNCIITSPPYWGLRSYGTEPQVWRNGREPCAEHTWGDETLRLTGNAPSDKTTLTGGMGIRASGTVASNGNTCTRCGAWRGELGLEPTPELYVEHMTQIFREARRVLRDDGTLWLNLGDSYSGSGPNRQENVGNVGTKVSEGLDTRRGIVGLKPKDLVGIPWRVAFALQSDGWYLRQDIIWAKPNPMPESVRDRCTKAHEYIFLLSKSQKYYFDADAIREPLVPHSPNTTPRKFSKTTAHVSGDREDPSRYKPMESNPLGRNRRSVWTVTTKPFRGAHFATFPPQLIEPMVLAGCPKDGTVLDVFNGAGTAGLVALQHGRNYIGIELKQEYIDMTRERLKAQLQLAL